MTSLTGITLQLENDAKIKGRAMLSREQRNQIQITSLEPGKHKASCLVCCSAPACCPMCSMLLPCCDDADYVKEKREASKYIYLRENSLEWNEPEIVMKTGSCLGVDPCLYIIKDQVYVVYFDDVMFDSITDQTRFCNECRTCFCGGRGERIRIDSTCCFGLCLRSSFPCPCIPTFCPTALFPCSWRHEINVEDASKAMYEIRAAIKRANRQDGIYVEPDEQRVDKR